MRDKNEFYDTLQKEEQALVEKLEAIRKVMKMFSSNGRVDSGHNEPKHKLGITGVIKRSFDDFPDSMPMPIILSSLTIIDPTGGLPFSIAFLPKAIHCSI